MISLLLALSLAQTGQTYAIEPVQPDNYTSRPRQYRSGGPPRTSRLGQENLAFFEAFPTSGKGTTSVCSTTAPTGAKGEVLTFTRASAATCTKTAAGGLATTGIADGDLVSLSTNVARVEYDSAGTLGLLVEAARTNSFLRSEEFDNASWLVDTSAPTVTANAAIAPDGTATADRVQAGAGGNSALYQSVGAGTKSASVYVRGVSGAGVTYLINYSALSCTACNFVSTSWTRCTAENLTTATNFGIGHASFCASTVASDAYVWGAQVEAGAYATSYIPTTSAAVTRAADSATFAGLSISSATGLSWAASVQHPSANGGAVWASAVGVVQDATNRTQHYRANSNVQTCDYFSTSGSRTATFVNVYTAGQLYREACSYSGAGASSTLSAYQNGVIGTTSAAAATSAWTATSIIPGALGTAATTAPADGIVSRVCVDPDPARCR